MTAVMVFLGGALGGAARYLLTVLLPARRGVPWGILAANVIGSFLLGVLTGWAARVDSVVWTVGFCGALTTFSTFAVDAVDLWRDGRRATAVGYLTGSLTLGLTAAAVGVSVIS